MYCCCCAGCQLWLHNPRRGEERLFVWVFLPQQLIVCSGNHRQSSVFSEDRVTVSFGCKLRGQNLPCLQCFRRMPCSWGSTAPRSNLSFPYLLLLPQGGVVCGFENPEIDGNRLRFLLLNQNALVECGNPMC